MNNTQALIDKFYEEEKDRLVKESTFTPLELSISSSDYALLLTIAKRFSQDKNMLAREALSQALADMFSALEPAERKMLAKEADELATSVATEIAQEQGSNNFEVSGTNWVQKDKACIREERKAEKEKQAMEQKADAQAEVTKETPIVEPVAKPVVESTDLSSKEDNTEQPTEAESEKSNSIFA